MAKENLAFRLIGSLLPILLSGRKRYLLVQVESR
jgi:hypothetical protein